MYNAVRRVAAGTSIQAALDNVPPWSLVEVEPGTYEERLHPWKPVTIKPAGDIKPDRATADQTSVTVMGSGTDTVRVVGPNVTLQGLCVKSKVNSASLVVVNGPNAFIDRCVVLGDPVKGQKRGITPHGHDTLIEGCYVDNCWLVGQDAQALAGFSGTKRLVVRNCYLAGGAESVMFGGDDPIAYDQVPDDILFESCSITKNPDWYALNASIKNALELKNAKHVRVRSCTIEYAGTAEGQKAAPIVLTVRNQGGAAPYSTVESVLIERCLVRFGGCCVNVLGTDDRYLSQTMSDVTLRDIRFTNIDPRGITKGEGKCFLINKAPDRLTLEHITIDGFNMSSGFYVIGIGQPPPRNLVIRNVKLPQCQYPIKIDNGGMGSADLLKYAPGAIIDLRADDTGSSI